MEAKKGNSVQGEGTVFQGEGTVFQEEGTACEKTQKQKGHFGGPEEPGSQSVRQGVEG